MEPLHITEFASQRYFEKIKQLKEKEQQEPQTQSLDVGPSTADPSPFILPIRGAEADEAYAKTSDAKRQEKEKRGLFGRLRHSKSILEPQGPRRSSVEEKARPRHLPFDQLFLNLPTELQVQIIASLPLSDVLNLRLGSRSWHAMITMNEAPIVRYHLDHHIPAYATRLYPLPGPAAMNFHYLCSLWHRLHVAAKLAYMMCEWITKEIFLRTTEAQRLEFAPQRERMRRRLIPLLFTIFHFFETYRALHLRYIREHGHGLERQPYTLNPIEAEIMSMYDDRTLLQVHQVFPLVVSSFCRRLRPPSYVGRVERTVRGYLREKPPDEVHVAVLCIGGLRQVERFWEIKGYNTRRGAVDVWYGGIAHAREQAPARPAEPAPKSRRGLMGLRKRSPTAATDAARPQAQGDASLPRRESVDSTSAAPGGPVFNTSLSLGMPMGSLSQEEYRLLLGDLPVLQKLWLATAEALIIDRRIVERPADIKRNAQVMLDLIREDGIAEEDEWWYGKGTPESIRPPLEAITEDPIE